MVKKSQRPPRPKPLCVYCGVRPGTTKDHVLPQALFTVLPEVGTITVKACEECNREKAQDEDYLADFLQSYFLAQHHPVALELALTRVLRSAAYHSSDLARSLAEEYAPVLERTPYAVPDLALVTSPLDRPRIVRAIRYIVRGLFAHYRKPLRLPLDCPIEVIRIPEEKIQTYLPGLVQVTPDGLHILGDKVVIVRYGISADRPTHSLWLLIFYTAHVFCVATDAVLAAG